MTSPSARLRRIAWKPCRRIDSRRFTTERMRVLSAAKRTTFDLSSLPDQAELRGVTAGPATVQGRATLRVALTEHAKAGTYGIDYVDEPTFVLLPLNFEDGVIEVDLLGRLLPDAPDYARAFIGLAYRVRSGGSRY